MTTLLMLCLLGGHPGKVQGKINDYIAKREATVVFKHGHDSQARTAITDAGFRIERRVPGRDIYLIKWGSWSKKELETNLDKLGQSEYVQLVNPDIEPKR